MKKVFIKEDALLARIAAKVLRSKNMAIVVGDTIYLHNTDALTFKANTPWLLHELKHIEQYQQNGTPGFLFRYLIYSTRYGYTNNPYEVSARNAENETGLLQKYELIDA